MFMDLNISRNVLLIEIKTLAGDLPLALGLPGVCNSMPQSRYPRPLNARVVRDVEMQWSSNESI